MSVTGDPWTTRLEPRAEVSASASDRFLPRWLAVGLIGVAALILISWALLAAIHVDDRAMLDHVSGARIALARYFARGTLYPDLYADGIYGGTRFMPLPIAMHAIGVGLTGDHLISGKVISYALMIVLLGEVGLLLRRFGCPMALVLVLPVLVLTTAVGYSASMNMRGDVLPLIFQLLAVTIARSPRRAATIGAGAVAALALLAKLNAVWAPIAITMWLIRDDRRRAGTFLATYVSVVVVSIFALDRLTDGRLLLNVLGLSTAGVTGIRSALLAPYRFVHLAVQEATTVWAIAPLVAAGAFILWSERQHRSIYRLSLVTSVAVVLVVLADVGTGSNQLLDPIILVVVVIGELAARMRSEAAQGGGSFWRLGSVIGVILLWIASTGFTVTIAPRLSAALEGEPWLTRNPLAGVVASDTAMLSEDPYVPVSVGQDPVILDPFMLPRLAAKEPTAIPDLVDRIDAAEFDVIVLVEPLDPVDRTWWTEQDFGADVVNAISRTYVFIGETDGYYVYEPRRAEAP